MGEKVRGMDPAINEDGSIDVRVVDFTECRGLCALVNDLSKQIGGTFLPQATRVDRLYCQYRGS